MRILTWVANYKNGTRLEQFQNGKEQKYADIDRELLERFDLVDQNTGNVVYAVYLREGERLIYRRRTLKKINQPDVLVYLVGWHKTIMTNSGPKNMVVLNYIHQDGSIALDGARNNLQLLPTE